METRLVRALGFRQATATNVVTMVGSGPFITIPLVISAMAGPQAIAGWLLAIVVVLCDGLIWAELGSTMPEAGGPYVYFEQAFGRAQIGRPLAFLCLWGILLGAPLLAAMSAVGFAQYMQFFWPALTEIQTKLIAAALCILSTILLYRDIRSVGRISVALFVLVTLTVAWIFVAALPQFQWSRALDVPPNAWSFSSSFFGGLGAATLIAILDYGGYANICLIGGEVKEPERTIPKAILYSILMIACMYCLLSTLVIGVLPWREVAVSNKLFTDLMMRVQGATAAKLLTALILCATFGSIFASQLGFSRILYAAAKDGQFFPALARLHPGKQFPAVAVLTLGALSIVACVFDIEPLIKSVMTILVITQNIPLVFAAIAIRQSPRQIPFHMWLYPLPAVIALLGWTYILMTNDKSILLAGSGLLGFGVLVYLVQAYQRGEWPFARSVVPS